MLRSAEPTELSHEPRDPAPYTVQLLLAGRCCSRARSLIPSRRSHQFTFPSLSRWASCTDPPTYPLKCLVKESRRHRIYHTYTQRGKTVLRRRKTSNKLDYSGKGRNALLFIPRTNKRASERHFGSDFNVSLNRTGQDGIPKRSPRGRMLSGEKSTYNTPSACHGSFGSRIGAKAMIVIVLGSVSLSNYTLTLP